MPDLDYAALRQFRRVHPEMQPLTDPQQTKLNRLTEAYDGLVGEHDDDPSEVVAAEIETLSDQIDALSQGTPCWKPEDIAFAGAVIGIGHAGKLTVERGLVRPEDMPQAGERGDTPRGTSRGESKAPRRENGVLPAPLVEDLTAHRTAALRVVLAGNADVALASVVHATALPLFYGPFEAKAACRCGSTAPSCAAARQASRTAPR